VASGSMRKIVKNQKPVNSSNISCIAQKINQDYHGQGLKRLEKPGHKRVKSDAIDNHKIKIA
jgi:hypothetical protein